MNSIPKFVPSIAALIASLALLWMAYTASKLVTSDGTLLINVMHHEPGEFQIK